jgi:hypothetical protein
MVEGIFQIEPLRQFLWASLRRESYPAQTGSCEQAETMGAPNGRMGLAYSSSPGDYGSKQLPLCAPHEAYMAGIF